MGIAALEPRLTHHRRTPKQTRRDGLVPSPGVPYRREKAVIKGQVKR